MQKDPYSRLHLMLNTFAELEALFVRRMNRSEMKKDLYLRFIFNVNRALDPFCLPFNIIARVSSVT